MTVFTVTVYIQNYTLTSKQSNKHILIVVKSISVMEARRMNEVALKYSSSHSTFSNGSSLLYSPFINL
jgi:hypothetical protein